MYIPYYEIAKIISFFLPKKYAEAILKKGNDLKITQNVGFIAKNKDKLVKKLRSRKVLNVAFYVYDSTKWKCDSIYELMKRDKRFNPYVFVTKNAAPKKNCNYQTVADVKKTYNFFKSKNMQVRYAYDIKRNKYISFEKMNPKPDIIIYQHPWYVETSQGPVRCSKFALTAYVPYYFPTGISEIDYYLRFHRYVQSYYVLNDIIKNEYKSLMANNGINLKAVGQPFLDYYSSNSSFDKKYIIYAPHWTVANQGFAYSTFEKYGLFLLDWAKKHSEYDWVFKPHPLLFKSLVNNNIMSESEVRSYYNEWAKIGVTYDLGDYLDIFSRSRLLITDRSSFLGEYFMTGNPVIYLDSGTNNPFNETMKQIIPTYYRARDTKDLEYWLDFVLTDDYLIKKRIEVKHKIGLENSCAAKNIINDILSQIHN